MRKSAIAASVVDFQVPDNRREQDDGRIGEEVALLINPCFIEVQKRDVGAFVGIRDIVHKAGVDGIAAVRAAGIVEVDDAELRLDGVFVQMPEQVVVGNACKVVEFIVVDEHRETLLDMLFDIVVQYGVAFSGAGQAEDRRRSVNVYNRYPPVPPLSFIAVTRR